MTAPRVRLLDVAARAGVSRTTASFVLTGRRDMRISLDAQERVLQAARELNYRPNLLARSLRTNMSQTIGLISDVIASESYAGDEIRGCLATALAHQHLLFVGETEGDAEVEKQLVQAMLDRGVNGFVYGSMYTRQTTVSKVLRAQPLVMMNCIARGRTTADGGTGRAGGRPGRRRGSGRGRPRGRASTWSARRRRASSPRTPVGPESRTSWPRTGWSSPAGSTRSGGRHRLSKRSTHCWPAALCRPR